MIDAIGDRISFRVVTSDRDAFAPEPYPGIPANSWLQVGQAIVLYLSPRLQTFYFLHQLLKREKADWLYLNSFFNWRFSILPLVARLCGARGQKQVLIAPRGEFAQGALALGKRRKKIWCSLVLRLPIYRSALWQASSRHEAADIRRAFEARGILVPCIRVASDVPRRYSSAARPLPVKLSGELRIVLIGRIDRMKNVMEAINIVKSLSGKIVFNIFGPKQDADYWDQCADALKSVPSAISIQVLPEIDNAGVPETLSSHHIFLLPTLGENFGHAIYEALSMGLPAVISDRTPWRGLRDAKAGWELPLENASLWRDVLHELIQMNQEDFSAMSAHALQYASRFAENQALLSSTVELFETSN